MAGNKQSSANGGLQFRRRYTSERLVCLICLNTITAHLLSAILQVRPCLK